MRFFNLRLQYRSFQAVPLEEQRIPGTPDPFADRESLQELFDLGWFSTNSKVIQFLSTPDTSTPDTNCHISKLPEDVLTYIFFNFLGIDRVYYRPLQLRGPVSNPTSKTDLVHRKQATAKWETFLGTLGAVCRGWLQIVGPLKYESITVDGYEGDFHRAFRILNSPITGLPARRHVKRGHYVRELFIRIDYGYIHNHVIRNIIRLVRGCPYLASLSFETSVAMTPCVVQQLWRFGLASISSSLQSLKFCGERYGRYSNAVDIIHYLNAMTNLTHLELEDQDTENGLADNGTVTLTSLVRLCIRVKHSSFLLVIARWLMPALRDFSLTIGHYQREREDDFIMTALISLFAVHGSQLLYLQLEFHWKLVSLDLLDAIFNGCPNMEEVALPLYMLLFREGNLRHAGLQHMMVTGICSPVPYSFICKHLTRFLRSVLSENHFPKVKTVHVINIEWEDVGDYFDDNDRLFWSSWFQDPYIGHIEIFDDNRNVFNEEHIYPSGLPFHDLT